MKVLLLIAVVMAGFFLFGGPALHSVAAQDIQADEDSPVVLELFTSQSCSSCPAADAVLKGLAAKPGVIALGCHVTYWDHLSWKDTLSEEFCTQRQRAYAAGSGSGRVFTPELRVNGVHSVVGSRTGAVMDAIRGQAGRLAFVRIEALQDGGFRATLPQMDEGDGAMVTLATYGAAHTQSIQSGENRGRTVDYTNPVLALHRLVPVWDGQARIVEIAASSLPEGAAGFAVLVQERVGHAGPGRILAAGQYRR